MTVTISQKPLLLGSSICSLYLLPGFFIHDPLLLALQLPHTKLGWPPMDKSSYPPNCSVPPLWWMVSSAHWCETKRYIFFMPVHIAPSSFLFSRTLGNVFQSCSFKGTGELAKPLAIMQESLYFLTSGFFVPSSRLLTKICSAPRSSLPPSIHSLAYSLSICWSVLGRPCISFVEYFILFLYSWSWGYFSSWVILRLTYCLELWDEMKSILRRVRFIFYDL